MTVAGRSRVYGEDITKLLLVNTRQADNFNFTPLTSLWVNESDLESDFPYHGGGENIRTEWEEKGSSHIANQCCGQEKSTSFHMDRKKNTLLLSPSFVI